MKEQSLVNLFELYDQAFDEVCSDLKITDIPDWHQRWFYRYLLINPTARYAPIPRYKEKYYVNEWIRERETILDHLYETGELVFDAEYSKLLSKTEIPWVMSSAAPSLYKNFSSWWFMEMRQKSRSFQNVINVDLFSQFKNWAIHNLPEEEVFQRWKESQSDDLRVIYDHIWKSYKTLLIPKYGSKKEILHQVSKLIDKDFEESFNIVKTKIPEKTVKSCFRVLEHQILFGEKNLIKIAESTDILEVSKAGLNDKFGKDSTNSVRVGVHRLSKIGLEIVNASSYGFFPILSKDTDEELGVQRLMTNFFKITTKETLLKIHSSLPPPKKMKESIRSDIERLGKIAYSV